MPKQSKRERDIEQVRNTFSELRMQLRTSGLLRNDEVRLLSVLSFGAEQHQVKRVQCGDLTLPEK